MPLFAYLSDPQRQRGHREENLSKHFVSERTEDVFELMHEYATLTRTHMYEQPLVVCF